MTFAVHIKEGLNPPLRQPRQNVAMESSGLNDGARWIDLRRAARVLAKVLAAGVMIRKHRRAFADVGTLRCSRWSHRFGGSSRCVRLS